MSSDEYPTVTCVECGSTVQATYSDPTKITMVERSLCFMCLFWIELVEERGDPRHLVSNGHHYTIHDENMRGMRGFGGRKWAVYFHDGRREITTNLWHQGEVPERFRERLPDNATLMGVPR